MTRWVFLSLGLLFFAVIIWALSAGAFFEEARVIGGMLWGQVMLLDLYVGFMLFSVFIFLIEPNKWLAGFLTGLLLFLGNGVALLYLALRYKKITQILKRGAL